MSARRRSRAARCASFATSAASSRRRKAPTSPRHPPSVGARPVDRLCSVDTPRSASGSSAGNREGRNEGNCRSRAPRDRRLRRCRAGEGGNAFDAALAGMCAAWSSSPFWLRSAAAVSSPLDRARDGSAGQSIVYDFFVQTPKPAPSAGRSSISAAWSPTSARRSRSSTSAWARSPRRAWSRGLFEAHRDLGRMPIRTIVEPAIGLARRGVPVNAVQAYAAAGGARDRRGRSGDARAVRQPRTAGRTDRRGRTSAPAGPCGRPRDPRHRGRGPVLSRRNGTAADARLRKREAASCRPKTCETTGSRGVGRWNASLRRARCPAQSAAVDGRHPRRLRPAAVAGPREPRGRFGSSEHLARRSST